MAAADSSDSPVDLLREKEVVSNKEHFMKLSHFLDFLRKETNLFVDI